MKFYFVLFLHLLVPALASATIKSTCIRAKLTGQVVAGVASTDVELLARFDADRLSIINASPLSSGVYLIETSEHLKYVLRAPREFETSARGAFAAIFMSAMPASRVAAVRRLEREASYKVADKLLKAHPEATDWIKRYARDGADLSVTPYYDSITGEQFLSKFRNSFRESLIHDSKVLGTMTREEQQAYRTKRLNEWNALSTADREGLIEDIKAARPDLKNQNSETLFELVITNPGYLSYPELERLSTSYLWRIPVPIRRQLADHWVLSTVLGISDFHWRNWLVRDGQIVAIDPYEPFEHVRGTLTPMHLPLHHHPYGPSTPVSASVRAFLMNDVSGDLKLYLGNLTNDRIRSFAREAGYSPSENTLNQIRSRIDYLKDSWIH